MDGQMTANQAANQDSASARFVPAPGNARLLRDAFGRFATGVTVVTTRGRKGPIGMTANSFSSVSMEPPLLLWCLGRDSDRFDSFVSAERYAIHVLEAGQQALSSGFARNSAFFDEIAWHEGADGVPALDACLARFDCALHDAHEAGDHVIVVGRILSVEIAAGQPLLFALGDYGAFERS